VDFKRPLSFNLEYISVASASEADAISGRLQDKETFEQIAKGLNQTPKETGLFGQLDPIPVIGWDQALANQLMQAEQGSVLELYKGEKEYFLFRVKEKRQPFIPEFKDIKDKVKDSYIKQQSRAVAKEKIDACLAKLALSGATKKEFEAAGTAGGLKVAATGLFKDKSYVEGIGASDKIFAAARDLAETAYSPVIELASGFYIVKRLERVGIDENKFEEEKTAYRQNMLEQKKNEAFNTFVEELFAKATGQAAKAK
jgi:parvulin-like peptidyl-prolyl isomerase